MKTLSSDATARGIAASMVILIATVGCVSASSRSVSIAFASIDAGCNATELATGILKNCLEAITPGTLCCSSVLPAVDIVDCLCNVVDEPQIAESGSSSMGIFNLYLDCGGKRRSKDKPYESCDDYTGTSMPSPIGRSPPPPTTGLVPPPPYDGDHSQAGDHGDDKLEISTDVGVWTVVLLLISGAAYGVYYELRRREEIAAGNRMAEENNAPRRASGPASSNDGLNLHSSGAVPPAVQSTDGHEVAPATGGGSALSSGKNKKRRTKRGQPDSQSPSPI